VDFLVRLRIGRRQYWLAMPLVGLAGAGGWALTAWSFRSDATAPWLAGFAILAVAAVLGLWVVFRRMNDSGPLILWFAGISVGGRLAEAAVRMAGGSRDQGEAALALFFVVVLLALGLAPSRRGAAPVPDSGADVEADAAL
jgi:hypothetical protein